ncbi:hypothetical protein FRB94_011110 [Tulasnella sp. JGI-2019a]|nr:hypothetical protein FRB94_011110 [Tulasnella sp. JGI-2019a]KAG9039825.1 hypothetical protein FRB95_007252 [Tulasnella sp. JGI-2019a]
MNAVTAARLPLASQVGGHPGIESSADGSLIIKPCLLIEPAFYSQIASDVSLAALRPHIPTYYGLLGAARGQEATSSSDASIVLENIAHNFKKPNLMDVKLGTILYNESMNEAKRLKMIKEASGTTSLESGVRLVGFQLYDPTTGVPAITPRDYGRALKVPELPQGIAKFFPSGYMKDKSLMIAVIDGIIDLVRQIKIVLEGIEMRITGGSILMVWEGDEAALAEGLTERQRKSAKGSTGEGKEAGEDGSNGGEEEEEEEEEESETGNKTSDAYTTKLIDFAHTRTTLGQGPDEGVLFGLETTLKLLRGRRTELAAETQ